MAARQFMTGELSDVRQKAVNDARKMQAAIIKELTTQGKPIPPYELLELIGKGSFGRVYKATHHNTGQLVAVKIISIEEGDSMNPTNSDTFSDILKEVNTLKMLNNSGARNINMVVDSLLVDQSIWMVTEYCAGGSVATLMRPTGGLPEKWIIPILREVAEAISWVHKEGIIHRDIKCANVLVTDVGGVQLCDFGVAGIMNTRFDKRSTVTGTLQWMAPELFESAAYGTEVDIWAFGSMVYEVASGLPPNATTLQNIPDISRFLKNNCPRLEGDQYSDLLKDMVAYCLVDDPAMRPRIEEIQQHPYIANTEERFPTASLSRLVKGYRLWETQGGSRRSLFAAGGAQGQLDDAPPLPPIDNWNFNTMTEATHQSNSDDPDASAVYDAYGPGVNFPNQAPQQKKDGRRRRKPPNLKGPTAPLEKVFDPNTLTNYRDNARLWYGRGESPPPTSDLPLRDDSQSQTVRESLVNSNTADEGNGLYTRDNNTIRVIQKPPAQDNRRTQDWTFPPMLTGGGSGQIDDDTPMPPTFDPPTEIYSRPNGNSSVSSLQNQPTPQPLSRASVASLIDLDESFADDYSRPSTSQSDAAFASDTEESFGLENHTLRRYDEPMKIREPSLYVQDGNTTAALMYQGNYGAQNHNSYSGGNGGQQQQQQQQQMEDEEDDGTIEIPDLGDSYREPSIYVTSNVRTDREPSLYAQIDLGDAVYERPESQMTDYNQSQNQNTSQQQSRPGSQTANYEASGGERQASIYIPSFESDKRQASMIIPDESRTDRQPSLLIPEDMEQYSVASSGNASTGNNASNGGSGRFGNTGQPAAMASGGYNGMYEELMPDPESPSVPPANGFAPRGASLNSISTSSWRQDSMPTSIRSSVASYTEFAPPQVPWEMSTAPAGPLGHVMEGRGTAMDMKAEMQRLISTMRDHLVYTGTMLETLPVRKAEVRRGREGTP
ncbi:hypothetical protein TD95_003807 [Thielaviopsis punctulata]|uniref:non-specific serine/threonine protein kinase n=1 Tax=Thielaviopsis punctulata TaxID=72032 RepID=A0A0F4ZBK4_9PEZI|nr:hypothetical protein TD95_003807 [Thielaviopsis punctulata]